MRILRLDQKVFPKFRESTYGLYCANPHSLVLYGQMSSVTLNLVLEHTLSKKNSYRKNRNCDVKLTEEGEQEVLTMVIMAYTCLVFTGRTWHDVFIYMKD